MDSIAVLDIAESTRSAEMALVRFDHAMLEDPAATLRLLAQLDDEVVEQSPELLLLRGWCRSLTRLAAPAWDDFRRADGLECDDPRVSGLLHLHWARCRAFIDGDVDDALERVTFVLEDTPADLHDVVGYAFYVKSQLVTAREGRPCLVMAERLLRWAIREWTQVEGADVHVRQCRLALAATVLEPLGRYRDVVDETDVLLADPELGAVARPVCLNLRAVAHLRLGAETAATADLDEASRLAFEPMIPGRIAEVAWIRVAAAAVAGDVAMMLREAAKAERALSAADSGVSVPFLTDMALEFGAVGELDVADTYLERARAEEAFGELVDSVDVIHRMRRGESVDLSSTLERMAPAQWPRALLVGAAAARRRGDRDEAQVLLDAAQTEMAESGIPTAVAAGEGSAYRELIASIGDPAELDPLADLRRRVDLLRSPVVVRDNRGESHPVTSQRSCELLAVIAAYGGSVRASTVANALYPDKSPELASGSLRVLLHRLAKETGLDPRTNHHLAFPADVSCDLLELGETSERATSLLRSDPDAAAPLALEVIATVEQGLLGEFDAPWADAVRRRFDRQADRLAKLLAAKAADAGDANQAANWARNVEVA